MTGRRSRARALLASLTALAVFSVPAACTSAVPTTTVTTTVAVGAAEDSVAQFAAAWQSAKKDQIAALTSDPAEAGQVVDEAIKNLGPTSITVNPGPVTHPTSTTASTQVAFVWNLPGGISWRYQTTWNLRPAKNGPSWVVVWAPSVIHPDLGPAQSLALHTDDAAAGTLVDRNNQQLVSAVRVYSVVALAGKVGDPAALGTQLAALLGKMDTSVTKDSVVAGLAKAAKSTGYTVTNLREGEFNRVHAQLVTIPGLSFPSQIRQLPLTKDFAKIVVAQVEPVAAKMVSGSPGWSIVTVDATGADLNTLAQQKAADGSKVTLTIDSKIQQAAEAALAATPEPAVLVAIQASTGEILAVAQNGPANVQGALALTGRYPPGSTFKIVTGSAAIDAKLSSPTAPIDCPGVFTVDSRQIHNEGFELGTVNLTTAFAKSCNTTFAKLATLLPDAALRTTASQYSIGRDFVVPGITTLTGNVPVADSTVQKAEDGFGQGVVLMTPFSAALMAATADSGAMPTPVLIRGAKTTVDQPVAPLSAAVRAGIRTLMRAVVTDGTAKVLQDAGTVYAKTGTADAGGKLKAHAWTVGFRGDLAFSVLIVNGDTSKRTNLIADAFLKAVPGN